MMALPENIVHGLSNGIWRETYSNVQGYYPLEVQTA